MLRNELQDYVKESKHSFDFSETTTILGFQIKKKKINIEFQ